MRTFHHFAEAFNIFKSNRHEYGLALLFTNVSDQLRISGAMELAVQALARSFQHEQSGKQALAQMEILVSRSKLAVARTDYKHLATLVKPMRQLVKQEQLRGDAPLVDILECLAVAEGKLMSNGSMPAAFARAQSRLLEQGRIEDVLWSMQYGFSDLLWLSEEEVRAKREPLEFQDQTLDNWKLFLAYAEERGVALERMFRVWQTFWFDRQVLPEATLSQTSWSERFDAETE